MTQIPGARELVEQLGGHPSGMLGLELTRPADVDPWLLAACLLSQRGGEARALAVFRALLDAGLRGPGAVEASPERLAEAFAEVGWQRPEAPATLLFRVARSLADCGGSLTLARQAEGLEDLGARLAALAPGLGQAAVARFLRPLREHWPVAVEIPLSRAARAAARPRGGRAAGGGAGQPPLPRPAGGAALHLGWLAAGEDEAGEPGALRARLCEQPDAPPLADVEAALERLGAAACLREAVARCPLQAHCPLRMRSTGTG